MKTSSLLFAFSARLKNETEIFKIEVNHSTVVKDLGISLALCLVTALQVIEGLMALLTTIGEKSLKRWMSKMEYCEKRAGFASKNVTICSVGVIK